MSVVAISTPFNIDLEFAIASFGKRFLAWLIDTAIQVLYLLAYVYVVQKTLPYDSDVRTVCSILFLLLPLALYHFLMELFLNGQSIGKKIVGIRVVNIMGNKPSVSQLLIRLMFRSFTIIPLVMIMFIEVFRESAAVILPIMALLMIGIFILYINSKLGQRIGDRIADTIVIEQRAKADFTKTIHLEITDKNYVVRYPEVMKLTDRDINGIRNLLDTKRMSKDTIAYTQRIAMRIQDVLKIQDQEGDSFYFLERLLQDYNYLTSR